MSLPRADELKTPPVVGKFYMVPCITVTGGYLKPGLYPVIGPKHEDGDHLGFPYEHIHLDLRFLPPAQARMTPYVWGVEEKSRLRAALLRPIVFDFYHSEPARLTWQGPDLVQIPCRRTMPDHPAVTHLSGWKLLHRAYADKRVKCGKCPHRGLPLESLPREPGTDIVTCPGHGLRWNLKTGELIR